MILTVHETAQKKKIARVLESFIRNLLTALRSIHEDISIVPFTRKDYENNPYLCVNLPVLSSQEKKTELLIQVKKAILSQGKFSLSNKPDDLTCVTISISLHNLETFKNPDSLIKIEKQSIQKIKENKEKQPNLKKEIVMKKPTNKDFQDLKKEIKNFLKMLQLNEDHYSQIIPEVDLSFEHGPVFFKEKVYADYVITQTERYKKLEGYVFARVGEIKNVYFKIGFINPLSEEQPLPHGFNIVSAPIIPTKAEVPRIQPVEVQEKNTALEKVTDTAEDKFLQLKLLLKTWGFVSGKDYSTFVMNPSKTFAVVNGIVDRRQDMIDAFTKNNLFSCLEVEKVNKSIRINLTVFKNPFPAPDKNNLKAPVDSIAKKITVKESPKINSEEKLADLRVFIHSSGIICGKHYAAITLNASKTLASINGVQEAGNPLRSELINKFKEYDLLECLNTTSTEKSIKVDLALFKKPTTVKFEPKQDLKEKVNQAKEDQLSKKDKLPIDFSEPLHKLEEIANQLHFLTKKIQFDPATIWDLIKSNFSKDNDFELLVRRKTPEGEISKLISKEELIKIFL
jgi:hypothetical protein